MKWQILTLTMPTRADFLYTLRVYLEGQIAAANERAGRGVVQHVIATSDPALTLGENRQKMKLAASADYISVVDDDDMVSPDYVDRILPLLDGVDYVDFRLQAYEDGKALAKPTFHSLLCGGWFESKYGYHRDISHLNPMKRELSLKAPMWGAYGEDSRWASEMRALGLVRSEHYVEDVMYHYLYRSDKTDGLTSTEISAGTCEACRSKATVRIGNTVICNACGVSRSA